MMILSVFLVILFFSSFSLAQNDTATPTFTPTAEPTTSIPTLTPSVSPTTPTVAPSYVPTCMPTSPSGWVATSAPQDHYFYYAGSADAQYLAAPSYDAPSYILVSQDYGNHWFYPNVTSICAPWEGCYAGNCISVSSTGQYFYSCVYDGVSATNTVVFSNDSGTTWQRSNPFNTSDLHPVWISIDSSSSGASVVALSRDEGYIAISNDYGVNWTLLRNLTGLASMYYSIACDGATCEKLLIAGDDLLYGLTVSDPNTVTLYYNATLTAGSESNFQAVVANEDFSILVAAPYNTAAGDNLVLSTDGGVTWSQADGSPSTSWWTVTMNQAGTVMGATDAASNVYLSYNNGSTWSLIPTPQGTSQFIGGIVVNQNGQYATISGSFIYTQSFAPTIAPTFAPSVVPSLGLSAAPSYRQHGGADDGDDELSPGETAGAVIGALLGAALLGVGIYVAYITFAGKSTLTKPLLDVHGSSQKENKELNAVL